MTELYAPSQIRAAEAVAMKASTDEITLMRYAAEGLLAALPHCEGAVGILCGKGNNAGDGYALAHLMYLAGKMPILYRFSETLTPAAAHYYALCEKDGIVIRNSLDTEPFSDCSLLVDCLFGIGFHGEVPSPWKEVIHAANASRLPILSADIPSGLSAISGLGDIAIRATQTLAIGGYKYGHFLGRGRDLCGKLTLAPIGLSPSGGCILLEDEDLAALLPPRPHHCHKGTFGTVTLLGGSLPYSGAPKLAGLAATSLRSGCGIARLAIPSVIANAVLPYLLEGTLSILPSENGHLLYDPDSLEAAFQGTTSAAIGMGMGRTSENAKILRWALTHLQIPLVIDADGLNTLAEMDSSILKKASCKVILTPHPKEFSRLTGIPMADILADPVAHAKSYAQDNACILLLKGTGTVITDGKTTYITASGSGGMATAGSGDVLAGVLAALLSWTQEDLLFTVAAGAHLCGVAGEIAAQEMGTISMVASDTASALPRAIRKLSKSI